MKIQLIRNATIKLNYAGKVFLIDPYLGKKHSQPSFAGISKNPTVNLPINAKDVLKGTDFVLVSHMHPDHFDEAAEKLIPKNFAIYCQPEDQSALTLKGFTNVNSIPMKLQIGEITIRRTIGQHGYGSRLNMMGNVSGYIFQHKDEPTLYWMGDTVWYDKVKRIIKKVNPDIIITHSCGAIWSQGELPVIMDEKQTVEVCRFAPNAKVVATHMEALDLATISRKDLKNYAIKNAISNTQLLIPEDGEEIYFYKQLLPR
ncbi:MBL fold metallo-hydrolase [Geojedonia litorea]|uniref:MBL fold metallo-hydrolase n=1 Tax=Geojedonia litorea TaxID=1268269 RepID=A0ABV9N1F2_9FLAO